MTGIDSLDYNLLHLPLSSPVNKDYTGIESISINILKVLAKILTLYKTRISLEDYFKRSFGTGVFHSVLNLIYESLINFSSNML